MQPPEDLTNVLLDGRYRLVRLMGQGGMGQVYEGVHATLGHKVAVKALLPRYAHDEKFRERFLREAKAASKVRHPNVVQIIDFGDTPGGSVYFVMEFLEGYDLKQLLEKEGRLGWPRAQMLLVQMTSALAAAHQRNIVHRDIKPANLFIVDQRGQETVKVLDFGIAKLSASAAKEESSLALRLTATGEVFGTAKYMAPEQAQGTSDDPRVDIYALGIVAYEMLTGQVPFTGRSAFQIISRHVNEPPRSPTELVPELPQLVEAAILKALAKKPAERFASMEAMERALSEISARPGTLPLISGRALPSPAAAAARPAWSGPMAWGKTESKPDEATAREGSNELLISEEITTARARAEISPTVQQRVVATEPSAPLAKLPQSSKRTEPRAASVTRRDTTDGVPGSAMTTLISTEAPDEAPVPAGAGVPSSAVPTLIPTEAPPKSVVSPRERVFIAAPSKSPVHSTVRLKRVTSVVATRLKVPALVGELAVPPADEHGQRGPMGWASSNASGLGSPAAAMTNDGSIPPLQGTSESGVASRLEDARSSGSRTAEPRSHAQLAAPSEPWTKRSLWLVLSSALLGGAVMLGGFYALSMADRDDAPIAAGEQTPVPEPEAPVSQGPQAPTEDEAPKTVAEQVEPELDAAPGGGAADVPAKPEPVAASAPPSRGAKAKPASPTDAKVKSQLTRTLEKKCGALGAGATVTLKILVASDGRVMSKSVTGATSEQQACLTAGIADAVFPPGTTRTITMTFE